MHPPLGRSSVLHVVGLVVCTGCAGDSDGSSKSISPTSTASWTLEPDGSVESVAGQAADPGLLFDPTRVMEVELELDPADWEVLRNQTRSMFDVLAGDCMASPAESPYTWFEADLWLDGAHVPDITMRKKGFIGSLSTDKPGLKLEFDELVDDRRVHGMERMALNNTPQDPTMLRTCLAYEHFRSVGVPAPRCGFAHVVVNGQDMGIYATVQAVDDHLLEDNGVADDAPLFEGTLSDLRDGWTNTYDLDSNTADVALLEPLVDAVESGDLDQISAVIHLDDFIRFWVAEGLTGHWDGYGWNTNNYYLYIDPTDGLARFVPWGTDAVWSTPYPGGGLDWIPLTSALTRALVAVPEVEAAYRAELARQLDVVGDPVEVADRIDAFASVIEPWHATPRALSDLQWTADFHLATLAASVGEAWPQPTHPLRDPFCMEEQGTISYAFEGDWGSIVGAATPGTCTGSYTWGDEVGALDSGVLYAGEQDGYGVLTCVHSVGGSGEQLAPHIILPLHELAAGQVETEFTVRRAALYYTDATMGGNWTDVSWMEGVLDIEAAEPGGTVRGSYSGTLWSPPW